jgi:hypothetical protein
MRQPADGERGAENRRREGRELPRAEQKRGRRGQSERSDERGAPPDERCARVVDREQGEERAGGNRQATAELADADQLEANGDQPYRGWGMSELRSPVPGTGGERTRGVRDPDLVGVPQAERAEAWEKKEQADDEQDRRVVAP